MRVSIKKFNFKKSFWVSFLFFLTLVVVRLIMLINWEIFLDSDESVVGIMAKHISDGNALPIFYYGQTYMGTLEQFTVALFFKVFGTTPVILKAVPFFYFLLAAIILYKILKKYVYKNAHYIFLFLAFPSLFFLVWSLKARGGFMEIVFLAVLFLFLLFKYQKTKKNYLLYFLGFIAGFSIYINSLIVPFLISVLFIFYIDGERQGVATVSQQAIKKYFFIFIFFIAGLMPIFMFKYLYSSSYGVSFGFSFSGITSKLKILFLEVIPFSIGGIISFDNKFNIFSVSEILLIVLNLGAIILVVRKYRKYFFKLATFRRCEYPKQLYFFVLLPVYLFVLLFSVYLTDLQSTRYLIFFTIIIPVYLLEAFNILKYKNKAVAYSFILLFIVLGLISSSQLYFSPDNKGVTRTYKEITSSKKYGNLIDFLIKNKFNIGFADYWDQWNINFISGERVRLAAHEDGYYRKNRYLKYWDEAINYQNSVYIYDVSKIKTGDNGEVFFFKEDYSYKMIDDFVVFHPQE